MIFTVAIDGPAASGKGTIGRTIAATFGFQHLDTGLLYRAVGAWVSQGADPIVAAQALTPDDLTRSDLRGEAAGAAASRVAAIPEVRAALVEFQKSFAHRAGGAVLDGRDIGTVICPQAQVKLFVTASDVVRAERRWREQGGESAGISLAEVLKDVQARDTLDSTRASSPLKPADDAEILDTTTLSVDQAVARAKAAVQRALDNSKT